MNKSITPNQIKQNNRSLIYHFIYKQKKVSQQDISYELRLSRPTVTSNLAALENDGLIKKNGQIDTEYVGRKAAAYSIVPDFRISIGVEILKKEVNMTAVNLYGEKISAMTYQAAFAIDESYFKTVCSQILAFKHALGMEDEQILGVGFAMQGLVTPDRQQILYGEILSCTGLSVTEFSRHLPYPCAFIHDADSAAVSELWASLELSDAFYLSLSRHLGAAMISKGTILTGKHGHNSTVEHIQMQPEGRPCYCGRRGCMETLLSLASLLKENESLESFFQNVRAEEPDFLRRWQHFLTDLARAVNLLHLIYDTDFILGGYIAPYLCAEDLAFIHEKIQEMTPFAEAPDFLRISRMPENNIPIGAGLIFIRDFLDKPDL